MLSQRHGSSWLEFRMSLRSVHFINLNIKKHKRVSRKICRIHPCKWKSCNSLRKSFWQITKINNNTLRNSFLQIGVKFAKLDSTKLMPEKLITVKTNCLNPHMNKTVSRGPKHSISGNQFYSKNPRKLSFHIYFHFYAKKHISWFYMKWTEFTRTFVGIRGAWAFWYFL